MIDINKVRGVKKTYSRIRKLSSMNELDVSKALLDSTMYNIEKLPPLGKEYWWFLFFGHDGEKPVQFMLSMFRKYGKSVLFNNKRMALREVGENKFLGVTTGWIYDGEKLIDLEDTNAITEVRSRRITSEISGQEVVLDGSFPDYKLKVGDIIDLEMKKTNFLVDKDARGVFLPPFGVGWVDAYLGAEGTVLGREFKGTAHLQKVVGVTTFGPLHWARIVFKNGSTTNLFCLKTGKDSKTYIHRSMAFFDAKDKTTIRLDNPKLKISRCKDVLVIEGREGNKKIRIISTIYARKKYVVRGGGSQVYVEYAIVPKEFELKTESKTITLDDLGRGVGTFEDGYW